MAITEVYKNPTVKQVIFQILFPNFFSMESKIGDYQIKIMEKFPISALLISNQFLLAQGPGIVIPTDKDQGFPTKKIWQFKTQEEDVILNITSDSLDITSLKHKTYNNSTSASKFRDTIEFVVDIFLKLIPLIKITKVGLRYLDDCPLPPELSITSFNQYYNSSINFYHIKDIKTVDLLVFNSTIKESGMTIIYRETLAKVADKHKYELDFDGQLNDIAASDYLVCADKIHQNIADWYENVIKEPVIKIMQNG